MWKDFFYFLIEKLGSFSQPKKSSNIQNKFDMTTGSQREPKYIFKADLFLRTPLRALEKHGEISELPQSELEVPTSEKNGQTYHHGVWLPITKPSDKKIDPEEKEKLKFLKELRKILESGDKIEAQKQKVKKITQKYPSVAQDFDKNLIKKHYQSKLERFSGVGSGKAKNLYEAGFRTASELAEAKIAEIAEVYGIGEATAKKIKQEAEKEQEKSKPPDLPKTSKPPSPPSVYL